MLIKLTPGESKVESNAHKVFSVAANIAFLSADH